MKKEVISWEEKVYRERVKLQEELAEAKLTNKMFEYLLYSFIAGDVFEDRKYQNFSDDAKCAIVYYLMKEYIKDGKSKVAEIRCDYERGRIYLENHPEFIRPI